MNGNTNYTYALSTTYLQINYYVINGLAPKHFVNNRSFLLFSCKIEHFIVSLDKVFFWKILFLSVTYNIRYLHTYFFSIALTEKVS